MLNFFKCLTEAVVENGAEGLLGLVPGGPFVYKISSAALEKYRKRVKDAEQRAEIQQLAEATFEQARKAGAEAIRQVLAEQSVPVTTARQLTPLEFWLAGVPDATRASLKRVDDPSGRSLPGGFVLRDADDVVKLLPPRPPKFTPGAVLPGKPDWVLDKLLGIGGYGEVWLSHNTQLDSLTGAVKFCHGAQASDLRHEAGVISRLMGAGRHPHIVQLSDLNLAGEIPWLMYEYVPGGTLTDWIHALQRVAQAQRQTQVLTGLKQLSEAVGSFHKLDPPIVHRDLKPSNILLNKSTKKLQITDFGIGAVTAKVTLTAESRGQSTQGGQLLTSMRGSHTPLYASPQQRTGAAPDPRDDVHALGVIGYQMLTGQLTEGPGPDFAADLRGTGASEELIGLLGRCVARDPTRRPASAVELTEELARVSRPRVTDEPPSPLPVPKRPEPPPLPRQLVRPNNETTQRPPLPDPSADEAYREYVGKSGFWVMMSGDPERVQGPIPMHPDLLARECQRVSSSSSFVKQKVFGMSFPNAAAEALQSRFRFCLVASERWAYWYPQYRSMYVDLWNHAARELKEEIISIDHFDTPEIAAKYGR